MAWNWGQVRSGLPKMSENNIQRTCKYEKRKQSQKESSQNGAVGQFTPWARVCLSRKITVLSTNSKKHIDLGAPRES